MATTELSRAKARLNLENLPTETLLDIASYLGPEDLARFQLVCRTTSTIGRDPEIWRNHCFERSKLYQRHYLNAPLPQQLQLATLQPPPLPGHPQHGLAQLPPLPMVPQALQPLLGLTAFHQAPPHGLAQHAAGLMIAHPAMGFHGAHHPLPQPQAVAGTLHPIGQPDQDGTGTQGHTYNQENQDGEDSRMTDESQDTESRKRERIRIMANWDPTYPGEKISWYDEWIQRYAPIAVNWYEPSHRIHENGTSVPIEARGLALYRPDNPHNDGFARDTVLAISPLDDGGICIWDVNGTRGKMGSIFATSKPGLLFIDGPGADNSRRSKRVDSGVTECVSVDSQRHRAFFAVQSHLIAVDLQTLSVVGCESFPWSITALSSAHPTVPLTIATNLGLHLHDYKAPSRTTNDHTEVIDNFSTIGAQHFYDRSFKSLFTDDPLPPYAPLNQPGPLSILHLPEPGSASEVSDDIYLAGRFPHIPHYDRRAFPKVMDTIYSGGSLCSMTASPYPFSAPEFEHMRRAEYSVDEVEVCKTLPGGRTLIAAGDYNLKGTLELYGLSPRGTQPRDVGHSNVSQYKNRFTMSGSRLLSVVNHGAKIAVCDAQGAIKWFERDGFTEVREVRIGQFRPPRDRIPTTVHDPNGVMDRFMHNNPFVMHNNPFMNRILSDNVRVELARKLVPTGREGNRTANDNDLVFWTGEQLACLGFSKRRGTQPEDFLPVGEGGLEDGQGSESERRYGMMMSYIMGQQADEARWLAGLMAEGNGDI